jgi:hypothetical protein
MPSVAAAQRGEVSSWLLRLRAAVRGFGYGRCVDGRGQGGGVRGRSRGVGSVDLGGRLGEAGRPPCGHRNRPRCVD